MANRPAPGGGFWSVRHAGMRWLLFSPSGRIGRKLFILGWLLLTAMNGFMLSVLLAQDEGGAGLAVWTIVALGAGVITVWASAMLSVKRLHDVDMAGALAVLIFVPALSILVLVALAVWPGTQGPNSFGTKRDAPHA
ncbi:DUF805 domain-containing protein [Pararhizobium haloflavum]|uniref:DUF805 domain-containing protein n=1 Tax=Pararhizobium haloflavum TaxID=2037914 RepID=UPI000C175D56|nr:DUF805 domain-containing protein [Pararhizobium haloflavum]